VRAAALRLLAAGLLAFGPIIFVTKILAGPADK
jgi:hypothetical protein